MLNHWTIVPVFVAGFLFLNLLLGMLASRRVRSTEDHVVGGRKFGFLLVLFIGLSETYSSVSFLGQPGWAYEHGVEIFANVGMYIGLMAFWLGPKIWLAGCERKYI